jgi:hypothetical protein
MNETRRRTIERIDRQNDLVSADGKLRQFINTPLGNRLTTEIIEPLASFFASELDKQPNSSPRFMRKLIRELNDPHLLALTALVPLLDAVFLGWDPNDPSALVREAGRELHKTVRRRYEELKEKGREREELNIRWSDGERLQAGAWLVWLVKQARTLDIFTFTPDGIPSLTDKWLRRVPELREFMIATNPSFAPLPMPPPPWTGWHKTIDGFEMTFVRGWRPEAQAATDAAFRAPVFGHAQAVNSLSDTPLWINQIIVNLVEKFAVKIMGHTGRQRRADEITVTRDVADARLCGDQPIWIAYNCDFRGRINALQSLNFTRADHVRAMFKFRRGRPLDKDDPKGPTFWLEAHCASCHGETNKKPWHERAKWAREHRKDIQRIAAHPFDTFDKGVLDKQGWKSADSKFQFVAACMELTKAWEDPENFVTTLPIAFDGSCNAIQHLACLGLDWAVGTMVNLVPISGGPYDVYQRVIVRIGEFIEADNSEHAAWWRARFKQLDDKQLRELLKTTAMTFAYAVTLSGATRQIAKCYAGMGELTWVESEFGPDPQTFHAELRQIAVDRCFKPGWAAHQFKKMFGTFPPPSWNKEPMIAPTAATLRWVDSWRACQYLAKVALQACEKVLPGPKCIMDYIQRLAKDRADRGLCLEWTSPSGFHVSSSYYKPKTRVVNCMSGGVRVQHTLAIGVGKIDRKQAISAAAANFVHSMDAAHLAKVVNAAAAEGIDLLTIHDSFSCLCSQAGRLLNILNQEFKLYRNNPLAELRAHNVSDPDDPDDHPMPTLGTKLVFQIWPDSLAFQSLLKQYHITLSIEDIKDATPFT